VLLNRLPPHARRPGEPWSDESHLLALLVDHVAELTWLTVKIANPKGSAARPRPIPRPPRRPVISVEDTGRGRAEDRNGSLRPAAQPGARPGEVHHPNWAAAIQALAKMPNVKVDRGADPTVFGDPIGGPDALRAP
jgi:hypothetical protein